MRKFIRKNENTWLNFYKMISVTEGYENIHSKCSEQDHSERGPLNKFVLEDGTTAGFQNIVFQLQWNSLKISSIQEFSCQICQDREAPKFSLLINIHIALLMYPCLRSTKNACRNEFFTM
jgi:hypothetical protein